MENNKYYDDFIKNDDKGNFLIESSPKCFNSCIDKITINNLSSDEKICILDCYSKMYYSFVLGSKFQ